MERGHRVDREREDERDGLAEAGAVRRGRAEGARGRRAPRALDAEARFEAAAGAGEAQGRAARGAVLERVAAEAVAQERADAVEVGAAGAPRVAEHVEAEALRGAGLRGGREGAERERREYGGGREAAGGASARRAYGHTPSSIAPSQSSSIMLQVSARGSTSPVQVAPQAPAAQVCAPARQAPRPAVPAGPL